MTDVRFGVSRRCPYDIIVRPFGIVYEVRGTSTNILVPIYVTLSGIVIDVKAVR
jgi:hypothetical protein